MPNTQKATNSIDWNSIFILNELYPYIDKITLPIFSIISKFIHKKLMPKKFSKAYLIGENISLYFSPNNLNSREINILENYSGYLDAPYEYYIVEEAELGLASEIAAYIKALEVKRVKECFYDLHPTVFMLSNLTRLELNKCTIPLLSFLKIGNHLQNLQALILKSVDFIELSKQEISPDIVNFPQNLVYLLIGIIRVVRWDYTPRIDNLIDPPYLGGPVGVNNLQGIIIPNLKILHVGFGNSSNFVRKLLKLNTGIEELIFDDFISKQEVYEQISLSKTLTKFKLFNITPEFPYISWDTHLPIPQLPAITNLELGFQYLDFATNTKFFNISAYFPYLRELTIYLYCLNIEKFDINNFISKNLPFFNTLDVFKIVDYLDNEVDNPYHISFNWENFVNVKCLVLNLSSLPLSKIDFDVFPSELREIRKRCVLRELNESYINNNQGLFKKWRVDFKGKFINFRKQL
ncbi:hypothetical protein CONCODRAFT_13112 [Conidiobolus coronatus NRRL 28638]|uniref:F-box domain-containing protein n=1 Tax=Conidiobolus coronatus (strain ATCC 28846 / CBS 209.66 / NRRL 28638) TaxID=796925 RepID=A0A137NRI8_CONC2|nr:hypothetical protein CONCODRAFT_13112 [Conidiobolus coronatus NRRL 28638]|eukprot:KXN65334.1 hypothetical protein CONCODRAFT_13112 [Conidiobolus coronatus NRRL 28638]